MGSGRVVRAVGYRAITNGATTRTARQLERRDNSNGANKLTRAPILCATPPDIQFLTPTYGQFPSARPITILLADDSEDDRMMTREALQESFVINQLREVEDGEELMDYLQRQGQYSEPANSPRPGLILLDLNMPRKSGQEALAEIRADAMLRRIPVVVLTTSNDEHDILRSYDLGVNSFITKPVTFEGLVQVMKTFGKYWIEIVAIPESAD